MYSLAPRFDALELGTQYHSGEAQAAFDDLDNPTPEQIAAFLEEFRDIDSPEVVSITGITALRGQVIDGNGKRFEYELDRYGSSINQVLPRDKKTQEPKKEKRNTAPVWVLGTRATLSAFDPAKVRGDIQERGEALVDLADRFEAGEVDEDGIEAEASRLISEMARLQAILGVGGAERLTGEDQERLRAWLRQQLYAGVGADGRPYGIQHLVNDLRQGMSTAKLRQRLNAYAKNTRQAFWMTFQAHAGPYGIRVLDPTAQHCQCCIAEAAKLPMPLSSVRLIGDCDCMSNCKCTMVALTLEQAVMRGMPQP